MNAVIAAFRGFFKLLPTKVGLTFAFVLPLLFSVVWMTGYNGATERLGQLKVGIVNEEGEAGAAIEQAVRNAMPFEIASYGSLQEAQRQLNDGDADMIVSIPATFSADAQSGQGELTFYLNKTSAETANAILSASAERISSSLGQSQYGDSPRERIAANVVTLNDKSNFATSMLPMILGFITYVAVMTMNIQFNIASMMLGRCHGKWQIFWARQLIYVLVAALASLLTSGVAMLFVDPVASFGQMWGFHALVYAAAICLTQMTFALFGGLAALVNTGLIPFQLMTAGNIVPAAMLAPAYRHLGGFLPASNGVQGFFRLIYSGASVGPMAIHLMLIAVVAWGITVSRLALTKPKPQPVAQPAPSH
ncbi:ABC-2 family transporter protein [Cohnella sp. OV330]|uniref:YhgE/Pip domain-containing protein n=1 Tax=Cohnella sp. OV330 TaxID=1855288 RepID=UPI0008EC4B81|nr:ABC transporter permease [Cohnella sp. OV330]SFB51563.1 ABC-2 family transporter protein [Cohnella sp. OV330]